MATKKKTNYISYEIKKLEKYYKQLETYLDDHPADKIDDRLDVRYSTNGNPIVKTIASRESQLSAFFNTLQKLPSLLESINNLRKLVDGDGKEVVDKARGDKELPGLFKSRMLGNATEEKKDDVEEEVIVEEPDDEDMWDEED